MHVQADVTPGATTYRLRTNGLTIFLDTWLERPNVLPKYLNIDDVDVADYIFISHAHFDQWVKKTLLSGYRS